MKDPAPPPPIMRAMQTADGPRLEWQPVDGGLELRIPGGAVILRPQEFEWFLADLKTLKPAGPVYRNAPPYPFEEPPATGVDSRG